MDEILGYFELLWRKPSDNASSLERGGHLALVVSFSSSDVNCRSSLRSVAYLFSCTR